MTISVKPLFAWHNLWFGFYWDKISKKLYFLPVPMCGIVIQFKEKEIYSFVDGETMEQALNERFPGINISTPISSFDPFRRIVKIDGKKVGRHFYMIDPYNSNGSLGQSIFCMTYEALVDEIKREIKKLK